jgi:hypothetical protein
MEGENILRVAMFVALVFGLSVFGYSSMTGSDDAGTSDDVIEVEDGQTQSEDGGGRGFTYAEGTDSYVGKGTKNDEGLYEMVRDRWKNVSEPLFEDVSHRMGFNYSASGTRRYGENLIQGVYISDVNNDLRADVLAIGGDSPVLFENTGDGFVRVREFGKNASSALFFDYDNDGWDDLYLLSDEDPTFYENEGGGFTETEVGLGTQYASVRGAAAADYTGNGCLDVFVIQANDWKTHRPEGHDKFVPIEKDNGKRNRLFKGNCEEFTETTEKAGIEGEAWSLATSFVDLTNDGYPDIHIANDFNNDVVYINNGDGTFDRNVLSNTTNRNAMSSEIADINGDGYLDIFVSNIYDTNSTRFGGRTEGNNLLINQGKGEFVDKAEEYGVQISGWGWAATVQDYDNDGYLDMYQSLSNLAKMGSAYWDGGEDGFNLVNSTATGFKQTFSVGAAALDYNLDGNLDIAVAYNDIDFVEDESMGEYGLYENVQETGNPLQIALQSDENGSILGTEVVAETGNRSQRRVMHSFADFRSQDARVLHFGLGNAETVDKLRIEYPDGLKQVVRNVSTDQRLEISRSGVKRRISLNRSGR